MADFSQKELRAWTVSAWILLVAGWLMWLAGNWARNNNVGIEEYMLCMMGMAGVIAFAAAAARGLVWVRCAMQRRPLRGHAEPLWLFLSLNAVFLVAAAWLVYRAILVPWGKLLHA